MLRKWLLKKGISNFVPNFKNWYRAIILVKCFSFNFTKLRDATGTYETPGTKCKISVTWIDI